MSAFKKLDDIIMGIEKNIISILILTISISIIVQVIARYIFNTGIIGVEDITKFGVVWITFWGTAICARKGTHVTMTAVLSFLPANYKKVIAIIVALVSCVFSFYLGILGAQLVIATLKRGVVSPALRLPVWYIYISAPLGFFLTSIYYLRVFIKNITSQEIYVGLEAKEETTQ